MFAHPSEMLRKRAFELCAGRAAPHELASLAVDALESGLRASRDGRSDQVPGLWLAQQERGPWPAQVASPDTARTLIEAVRSRLTPAHQGLIRTLAAHQSPELRRLAAQWAGELGDK